MGCNPSYKINPTYPIYNWGHNPLTKWDEPPCMVCFGILFILVGGIPTLLKKILLSVWIIIPISKNRKCSKPPTSIDRFSIIYKTYWLLIGGEPWINQPTNGKRTSMTWNWLCSFWTWFQTWCLFFPGFSEWYSLWEVNPQISAMM